MKRAIAALLCVLVSPQVVAAHEGHDHKFMGTVSMIHENHLEVRTTDGRTTTIALEEKTRILRGKRKVAVSDIKTGERAVVTATEKKDKDGKPIMVAKEVRLAEAASGKSSSEGGDMMGRPTRAGILAAAIVGMPVYGSLLPSAGTAADQTEPAAIESWLAAYDAAFNAKDVEKLATFYHPDVTSTREAGSTTGGPTSATIISDRS